MKRTLVIFLLSAIATASAYAQKENLAIRNGNKLYKQNSFDQSLAEFQKAVSLAPHNAIASYNLGNASYRSNKADEAITAYGNAIADSKKKPVKEKAYYNQGVVYSKQQKLQESINVWKEALKLDPEDKEARENLQKALLEQKNQQNKENEKKDKNKKDDQQKQDKNKQQQPKDQQSRLNKKQVEQLLKALSQKEKEVQQKMQSKNASPTRQEKDW